MKKDEMPITMEDEPPVFVALVMLWVRNTLIGIGLLAILVVGLGMWGYYSYEPAKVVRPDKCINAACEKACEDVKKFKRHEGCVQ